MKKDYMKRCLLLLCCTCSGLLFAQTAPKAIDHTDYIGTSFVANWKEMPSVDSYYLSVFEPGDITEVVEDFDEVNHTEGKIDLTAPNYPQGWLIGVSENGDIDVSNRHLVLDATGDYVQITPIVGCRLNKLIINASMLNAAGIDDSNSSKFVIDIYNQAGERITGGTLYSYYFSQNQELDLFVDAFQYVPANIGSFKFSLEKEDGKIGDIVINSITYSYTTPNNVLADYEVATNSYEVAGLDAEKEYFYYVKGGSKEGDLSNIVRVNGFLTPVSTQPSHITSDSYTAHWEVLPKAIGYIVQNYKYVTMTGNESLAIIKEDFSKVTEGTIDVPVSITDIDAYTNTPGWSGRNMIAANGMIGASSGRFPMNLSYLYTPKMNLDGCEGEYTVSIKAYGKPGDYLSLYRANYFVDTDDDGLPDGLNIHKVTFGEDGWAEETWTMDDGAAGMIISIEDYGLNQFLMEDFSVAQKTTAGDVIIYTLEQVKVEGQETTSYTFTGLEANATYAYDVTGIRADDFGREEMSAVSELIVFDLTPAGIEDNECDNTDVAIRGNTICVTLSQDATIRLVTIDGRVVDTIEGIAGENLFTVPSANVYILQVGKKVFKLIAR